MSVRIEIGNTEIAVDAEGRYELRIAKKESADKMSAEFPKHWMHVEDEKNFIVLSTAYWKEFCLETGLGQYFYTDLGLTQLRNDGVSRKLLTVDCQKIRLIRVAYEKRVIGGESLDDCTFDQRRIFGRLLWLERRIFRTVSASKNPGMCLTSK